MKNETKKKKTVLVFTGRSVLLLVLMAVSAVWGRYPVSIGDVCKILASRVLPVSKSWTDAMEQVVLHIRLPRILLGGLVGCCLSAAGACYQGVFQNPMAAPDVLGASSGAGFGAALAIIAGFSGVGVTASAFVCSLATVAVAFLLAQKAPGRTVVSLVLAGIIVSSLLNAGTSYLKLVADPNNQLPAITYWLMGSFNNTTIQEVAQTAPVMLIGLIPLLLLRWKINILTMGDAEARTLGVNTAALRLVIIVCATLITAASIAAAGMIGWVGLVIPHISRKLVGSNFKVLLPTSMLAGASFLLLVDSISRNLYETELPVGILTAVVGAPFFLYLMLRKEDGLDA